MRQIKAATLLVGLAAALATALASGCGVAQSGPALVPVDDQVAYVGSELAVTLRAFDGDRDQLSYGIEPSGPRARAILANSRLVSRAKDAVFYWTPQPDDVGEHAIDFIVSDGGGKTRQTVVVRVLGDDLAAASRPVFLQPIADGITHDLAESPCIDVDVRVEDTNSTDIDIRQATPLAGSTLTSTRASTNRHTARFHWCPTPAQRAQPVHLLRFVADDRDAQPVVKDFRIVFEPDSGAPGGSVGGTAGGTTPDGRLIAPFKLDFESSGGGLAGNRDWKWGKPSFSKGNGCSSGATAPPSAHSGSAVWGTVLDGCYSPLGNAGASCKNTSASDDSILTLKFDIPAGNTGALLSFYEWRDVFSPYDWTEIRVNGEVVRDGCSEPYKKPTRWVKRIISLKSHVGKTVTLSLHFVASKVANYAGWYIDDLEVKLY